MRVLITTDSFTPTVNGVVTSIINLRRELTKRGHEVRVLTLSQTPHSYYESGVTYIGSVSAEKVYPGARFRSAPARKLVRDIVEWEPEIIHSQNEFSTFIIAHRMARKLGIPIVHTYHTVYEDYTHYFSPSQHLGQRMASDFSRWIIGKTSCVIVPTDKMRLLLRDYGVPGDIHVIPTGIELGKFMKPANPENIILLKQRHGIPASNLVLVFVGRLAKEKNVDELISYFSSLQRNDMTLLLVGDGPAKADLERQTEQLCLNGNVIFSGMVAQESIADYYHLGDLFVNASSSEAQGLTYIEALSSGLPALCRKDPCLDGVVIDGINGWQYNNQQEFTAYLNIFADDMQLRQSMHANTTQYVGKYSSETFAEAVENVYLNLLKQDIEPVPVF